MADIRITGLPIAVHSLGGLEIISVVQPGNATGTTSQATIAEIRPINNRVPLTTDGTFHLSTTGSFTTGSGLSTTSPWGPDIQQAMTIVSRTYDFRGVGCTFSLANGTYIGQGGATGIFIGAGTDNWGNLQAAGCKFVRVTSDAQNATAVTIAAAHLISYQEIPYLDFRYVTLRGTVICENGFCLIHNCNFQQFDDIGATAGFGGMFADFGQIVWSGVSRVVGSAHFVMQAIGGILQIQCTSIIADGGIIQPRVGAGALVPCIDQGEVSISSSTVWGTANGGSWTGTRFQLLRGSTINANGLGFSAIPGTSNGIIGAGCTYVG